MIPIGTLLDMKKLLPKIIGFFLNVFTLFFPKMTREKAFDLLCKVQRIPISEDGMVFFSNGETQWIDVLGAKTALHKWGAGSKKVLFMHGWMSHSQRWREYVGSLDLTEYTCYALDAPGHGASEGNKLNLEIYRQAYEKTLKITGPIDVLVSHSLGNLIAAYQFLWRKDVLVASYVIMGSPSGMDAIFMYFEEALGLSPRMLKNLAVKINQVLKLEYGEVSMENFFRKTDKPILLIHEETDTIAPIAPIRKAVAHGSSIDTHYSNGLKHTLKSPEVLTLVNEFINQQTKMRAHVLERI